MGLTPNPAQTLQSERLRYPGMLVREILIWQNWLKAHESAYERFDYNVRIGPGYDPGPAYDEATRFMALANSKKRMDAVIWKGNQATLVEVKDRAGASALGQLLTYLPLWAAEHLDVPRPKMLLVSNRIQPGIDVAAQYHGVFVNVVPTDFSILARQNQVSPFLPIQRRGTVYL